MTAKNKKQNMLSQAMSNCVSDLFYNFMYHNTEG